MASTWGRGLQLTIFGESHGAGTGAVLEGLPIGMPVDEAHVAREMARRAPGKSALATARHEPDTVELKSGVYEGRLTGAPVMLFISNTSARSGDYDSVLETPRPSHADYAAHIKYNGFRDHRGGGFFSARLTAALVAAGALCKQWLAQSGIHVGAHISCIAGISDVGFDAVCVDEGTLSALYEKELPALDDAAGERMRQAVLAAKQEGDSVGGIVECAAIGLPVGLGEPYFEGLDSAIASLLFAIPAVKGVEFGAGFAFVEMRGSAANDAFCIEGGKVGTKTNHSGGMNAGLSNGMPLIVRAAFRPTPSIRLPQQSVNLQELVEQPLCIEGRHDPCVAVRGLSVVEAAVAVAVADALLMHGRR